MSIMMSFETTEQLPPASSSYSTSGWLLNTGLKKSNMNWTDIQIHRVIKKFSEHCHI
jgi:hypothetical protein